MTESSSRRDPEMVDDQATQVRLSYRLPDRNPAGDDGWALADSGWVQEGLEAPSYRRYLRHAHAGPIEEGTEWQEFINCGCASPMDVVLRVESVFDGTAIGDSTAFEIVHRSTVVDREAPTP